MKKNFKRKLLFNTAALCFLHLNTVDAFQYSASPWIPRFSFEGFAGSSSNGKLDILLPVFGNSNGFFYTNAQGKYGNDSAWLASLGLGVRQIINDCQLWGAYVFADKNVSSEGKSFWYISPGIESLGNVWDFRANAYIPTSAKKKFLKRLFEDELGNFDFITFRGHQQFNHQVELFETVGTGIDAEVGRALPATSNLRLYVGGYYFQPKQEDDIKGVETRIEYTLNSHAAFNIWDSYDNFAQNTIGIGVRVSLGGVRDCYPNSCIRSRMLDPVIRNLGALSTGAGVPIVRHKQDTGEVLQRDNIWFFDGATGLISADSFETPSPLRSAESSDVTARAVNVELSQGTFENPFNASDFNQTTIDAINQVAPNANLYFSPGRYFASSGVNPISINTGQSLFGRTADYKLPAIGNLRANFLGAFIAEGRNNFESLILLKDGNSFTNGFTIEDTQQVLIKNVDVGINQFNNTQNFDVGIFVDNSNNILIDHSSIYGLRTNVNPVGVSVLDSSNFHVNHSTITASLDTILAGNLTAFTIFQSNVSIFDSTINSILHVNGDNSFIRTNNAVDISEDSIVTIAGSHITSTTRIEGNNNDSNTTRAIALQASLLTLSNNVLEAEALVHLNNNIANQAQTLFVTAGLSLTVPIITSDNNIMNASAIIDGNNSSAASNQSFGIYQDARATVTSALDTINANATVAGSSENNSATGIHLTESGSDNLLTIAGSTINATAIVNINDSVVGENIATGIEIRSSDTNVSLLNTTLDAHATVTSSNNGSSINSARGFFVDTSTALNYQVSIIDSVIRAFAIIPEGSTSPFNSASAISPLNDPNVLVINTAITEVTEP